MADNVTVTDHAGAGAVVASDEVSGAQYQIVKLAYGADGSVTQASSANPVPVETELPAAAALADSVSPTVPTVGAAGLVYDGADGVWHRQRGMPADDAQRTGLAAAANVLHNGSTWDRQRNNTKGTLLASAARTATTTSADQTNYNARGVVLFLNVTAVSGTGGLQTRLRYIDPISATQQYASVAPTVVTATGLFIYVFYVGAAAGNVAAATSLVLPRDWAASVVHGDASSYTYSLGYATLL